MQDKNPINLKVYTPPQWKGNNIVAYFQATIAGGFKQRVKIVNDERVFQEVTGETAGVNSKDFGKQFLNNKQNVSNEQHRSEYNFKVWVEHDGGSGWEQSDMKCESVKIGDKAAFGIVISDDKWPSDTDFNDCVVIIGLYEGRE